MTKSTITREQLLEIIETDHVQCGEASYLARMALAAMDGEPVAWTWHYREQWHVTNDERRAEFVAKDGDVAVLPLYLHAQPPVAHIPVLYKGAELLSRSGLELIRDGASFATDLESACMAEALLAAAQPAPAVPDGLIKAVEFYEQVKRENPPVETGAWKDAVDWVLKEASRVAMVQELKKSAGAEATCRSNENAQVLNTIKATPALGSLPKTGEVQNTNSPAIPDCWCCTCRPVVLNDMRFVVCPDCGNKRCPRANDHRNACTGSNEPGQEGSAYPDTLREVK